MKKKTKVKTEVKKKSVKRPHADKRVKELSEMESMKHYIGIICEDFDAKIATVIEAVQISKQSLERRMDGLEYKMDVMKEDMDTRFLLLSKKMDKVIDRVDNHEERITNLEAINT